MRSFDAIARHRWLVASSIAVALSVGALTTCFVRPEYQATATIRVGAPGAGATLRLPETSRIVDTVVRQLALYAWPSERADSALLATLTVGHRFMPGTFNLDVDDRAARWQLSIEDIYAADSGVVGDSIGRRMGLLWAPDLALLRRAAGRRVRFVIATPRETSAELRERLTFAQLPDSNIVRLTLTGTDPQRAARALNAIAARYVAEARDPAHADAMLRDSASTPREIFRHSVLQLLGVALLAGVVAGVGLALLVSAVSSWSARRPESAGI